MLFAKEGLPRKSGNSCPNCQSHSFNGLRCSACGYQKDLSDAGENGKVESGAGVLRDVDEDDVCPICKVELFDWKKCRECGFVTGYMSSEEAEKAQEALFGESKNDNSEDDENRG